MSLVSMQGSSKDAMKSRDHHRKSAVSRQSALSRLIRQSKKADDLMMCHWAIGPWHDTNNRDDVARISI
jgi:hypothetical protein